MPRRQLAAFPRVIQWAADTQRWDGEGELAAFPGTTPFGRFVLDALRGPYKGLLLANAHALQHRHKAFTISVNDREQSFLARPYPETSRHLITDAIRALSADERRQVTTWLTDESLADAFAPEIASHPT